MTFKEFKKQHNLNPKSGFCISFDYDIYCDMAERAGYEPDGTMEDYYGGHVAYLESHDIDLWHENIFIQDDDLDIDIKPDYYVSFSSDKKYEIGDKIKGYIKYRNNTEYIDFIPE